jgi:hypothetical protein
MHQQPPHAPLAPKRASISGQSSLFINLMVPAHALEDFESAVPRIVSPLDQMR